MTFARVRCTPTYLEDTLSLAVSTLQLLVEGDNVTPEVRAVVLAAADRLAHLITLTGT